MELAPMRFCWPLIGVGDAWPSKGRAKWHRRPCLQALPQQFQLLSTSGQTIGAVTTQTVSAPEQIENE